MEDKQTDNVQTTEQQRPFGDGSDDSQNMDEDAGEAESNVNNYSERDVFSIDEPPPSFGAGMTSVAAFSFHEPTDLKWDPLTNSDDNVSSPKKDGSDDSINEFMDPPERSVPHRVHSRGKESYGNVVSEMSFFEKFGNEHAAPPQEIIAPSEPEPAAVPRRIHQKGKESYGNVVSEMSFFEKFGSKSEEEGEAHLDISSPKTDSTSDPFMTPPGKPKVHRKGKESYGMGISGASFFEKFGEDNDESPPTRSLDPPPEIRSVPVREVRSTPQMRSPEPSPTSKISTLVSQEEARAMPTHRQKQASVGFAISDLSFSQKFGIDMDDDPPPVLTVTEHEPEDPGFDLGEENSTSTISGNNENEELEALRAEIQNLRDELFNAQRIIVEQRSELTSKELQLQACTESKVRLLQNTSEEITRLSRIIGRFAKHQKQIM